MMSLAEFLLNNTHEHNGHKQTEVKGLSIEDGQTLCQELNGLTQYESVFIMELWPNGNYTIYQKDYFDVGHIGGTDRMILSVTNT